MKLHEYQAKSILSAEGVHIPESGLATTASEAKQIALELEYPVVLKAQVLTGGRGKAGGIKLVKNDSETESAACEILNSHIKGISVQKILVEKAISFQQELYLGITYNRVLGKPVLIFSSAGGIEIEEIALSRPNLIFQSPIDALLGLQDYAIRALASQMGLERSLWKPFQQISHALWKIFTHYDATLVEINPLVVSKDGQLIALDAKMTIDENALFRQRDLVKIADQENINPAELEAKKFGVNYIQLKGNIGCLVNGAGLAMATMDCIYYAGGKPANFLDIGGGATAEKIYSALGILFADNQVRALLINIFGGITRCDEVAKGLLMLLEEGKLPGPIVVRFEGTNAESGISLLEGNKGITFADTLMDAAKLTVAKMELIINEHID